MHPGIGGDQIYGERASPSLIPSTGRQHQATWSPKKPATVSGINNGWRRVQLLNNWLANHCFQPTNAHTVQLRGQYKWNTTTLANHIPPCMRIGSHWYIPIDTGIS